MKRKEKGNYICYHIHPHITTLILRYLVSIMHKMHI